MRKNRFNILNLEDFDDSQVEGQGEVSETPVADSIEAENDAVELNNELTSFEEHCEQCEDAIETVAELQDQVDIHENIIEEKPEEVTEQTVELTQEQFYITMSKISDLSYYGTSGTISHELSYGTPIERLKVSCETVKEVITKIIEKIKAFFAGIYNWFKKIITGFINFFKYKVFRLKKAESDLNKARDELLESGVKAEDIKKFFNEADEKALADSINGYLNAVKTYGETKTILYGGNSSNEAFFSTPEQKKETLERMNLELLNILVDAKIDFDTTYSFSNKLICYTIDVISAIETMFKEYRHVVKQAGLDFAEGSDAYQKATKKVYNVFNEVRNKNMSLIGGPAISSGTYKITDCDVCIPLTLTSDICIGINETEWLRDPIYTIKLIKFPGLTDKQKDRIRKKLLNDQFGVNTIIFELNNKKSVVEPFLRKYKEFEKRVKEIDSNVHSLEPELLDLSKKSEDASISKIASMFTKLTTGTVKTTSLMCKEISREADLIVKLIKHTEKMFKLLKQLKAV